MKTKYLILTLLILTIFIIGCGGSSVSKVDYEGTWKRQGTYTNGALVNSVTATMKLTKISFDSYNSQCANSGDLNVQGTSFVMTVKKSNCPSIINVGSVVKSTYSVAGNKLTIINKEYGAEVKEIYNKVN